jgi:ribosomal protein L16/L10AE
MTGVLIKRHREAHKGQGCVKMLVCCHKSGKARSHEKLTGAGKGLPGELLEEVQPGEHLRFKRQASTTKRNKFLFF